MPFTKEDVAPLTLRLKRSRLTTVMSIAQRFGNIRFVFRKGMVLIQHPDEVKEFTWLRSYSIKAATAPLPSFPGPELKLTAPGEENFIASDEDPDENNTASGFTPDKLVDMIRTHVLPESWMPTASRSASSAACSGCGRTRKATAR